MLIKLIMYMIGLNYNYKNMHYVAEKLQKTVTIEKKYMEIEERGVKLRLTIVDTPGYNDSLCGEDR